MAIPLRSIAAGELLESGNGVETLLPRRAEDASAKSIEGLEEMILDAFFSTRYLRTTPVSILNSCMEKEIMRR